MTKPTKEQQTVFWKWYGWSPSSGVIGWWVSPDGKKEIGGIPIVDYNNLYKYAIPKLFEELSKVGKSFMFDRIWEATVRALLDKEDVALALFWVCDELRKEVSK